MRLPRGGCTRSVAIAVAALLWLGGGHAYAQEGVIAGRVRQGDRGLRHVEVRLADGAIAAETDADGRYQLVASPGTYTVVLRLAGFEAIERGVVVTSLDTTLLDTQVDWPLFYLETVTVVAPARYPERMAETSAAAVGLLEGDFRVHATHGQLPRVLATTPGVELVQSGIYDFNLNMRGFNTAINRHVKTMIDGRDPSVPVLLGYQDWAANSIPLDDIDRTEVIRGPGAALYGAGAFNGVVSITTKPPRLTPGGYARFTFGSLDTKRVEARHATPLGSDTWLKILGSYHRSGDFTRSRVASVEYAPGLLPREVIAPPRDRLEIASGSVRIDHAAGSRLLVGEVGTAVVKGLTTVTAAGRTQADSNSRPWARASVSSTYWTATAYYSGQRTGKQVGLSTGAPIHLDADNVETEFVVNRGFAQTRGRYVAGGSIGWQRVNSADPNGVQTVFSAPQQITRDALFGEVEYRFTERLRSVAAARVDDSELHSPQLSPRLAIVYALTPRQHARVSVSRAFQSPSVTEFFLSTAVAPPVDLSPLENVLAPVLGGTTLGFGSIPVLAVGNEQLEVERISAFEAGYTATFGQHLYVTVDYYRNRLRDFTSNLLPQLGTLFGRINPAYAPYTPPATLPAPAAAAVGGALAAALPPSLLPLLSNDSRGNPVFAALSFRNIGAATTQGVETGVHLELRPRWRASIAYSLFTHDLDDERIETAFSPNAPRHTFSATTTYDAAKWSGSLRYRWVDAFRWSSGIFAGPVPSFGAADAQALYSITPSVAVGFDVANIFNREHYELFGGDLLRRRVLASVRYGW